MYFLQNVMGIMQETDPETMDSCWGFVISIVFAFSIDRVNFLCFALFCFLLFFNGNIPALQSQQISCHKPYNVPGSSPGRQASEIQG